MPTDFISLLDALGNASGWAIATALLIFGIVGLIRGWVVPGYLYEREVARGDGLEAAADQSARTVERAAAATEAATNTALSVSNQLTRIATAVARLEHRDEPA